MALLTAYAEAISKHDLDLGHCNTLLHEVRMTDSNRIVSINQSRLPHHKKGSNGLYRIARSRCCPPEYLSTHSTLMLVKSPMLTLGSYSENLVCLVQSDFELNKSIQYLYELLDKVATGKMFSVL